MIKIRDLGEGEPQGWERLGRLAGGNEPTSRAGRSSLCFDRLGILWQIVSLVPDAKLVGLSCQKMGVFLKLIVHYSSEEAQFFYPKLLSLI